MTESIKAAIEHSRAGRSDEAERIARRILEGEPQNVQALQLLGALTHERGRFAGAADYFTRAAMLSPDDPASQVGLGNAKLALGKRAEAVECFREALRLRPEDTQTRNGLGVLLASLGKLDDAVDCFRRVLDTDPKSAPAHTNLGNILAQQGRMGEAIECFRAAVRAQPDLAQAYNSLANALKAQGKIDEAIEQYRLGLAVAPNYAEGHYNLGLALFEAGRPDDAVASYREALRLRPDFVEAHFNLGCLYKAQGSLTEALGCFEKVLAVRPGIADVHFKVGLTLKALGRLDQARPALEQALALKPTLVDAHLALGNLLVDQKRYEEAAASFQNAIRHNPKSVEAHTNLGNLLRLGERLNAAADCYHRALEIRPDCAEARVNLGQIYQQQKLFDAAANCYRQVLDAHPDANQRFSALRNLANLHADRQQLEEARETFEQALAIRSDVAEVQHNYGKVLADLGDVDGALARLDEAVHLDPSDATVHTSRAIVRLLAGDYEQGWPEYEWRWQTSDSLKRPSELPEWDGSSLEGRTILLHYEQGLGDTLQFIRYAPLVQQRGGNLVILAPKNCIPILSTCAGLDPARVQFADESNPIPRFDTYVALMSLPGLFKTTLETIPADVPYLGVSDERVEAWRPAIGSDPVFRVGIAWQGNPVYPGDRQRSIPLAQFAPLAAVEGVRLFSLQHQFGTDQLDEASFPIVDLGTRFNEEVMIDAAAVIKNLDLVISCDSAIVHLAGALAAPTWVAVPSARDWRWMVDRSDNPWYPTVRVFRQSVRGDWTSVMAEIAAQLAERACQPRRRPNDAAGAAFID